MITIISVVIVTGFHLVQAIPEYIPSINIPADESKTCQLSQQQIASARKIYKEHLNYVLRMQHIYLTVCGEGKWLNVAYLNMKNVSQTCPSAWRVNNTNGVRICGRPSNSHDMCHSTFYSTGVRSYNKVCGRVIGYQIGHPDAFHNSRSIDEAYVEGVSITHGSPRSHIWTYAADYSETSVNYCPCDNNSTRRPPPFVGNNYYCESGNLNNTGVNYYLFAGDPL